MDRSRTIVATWLAKYIASNIWLSMYAFAKPADFELSREKVLSFAEQQVG